MAVVTCTRCKKVGPGLPHAPLPGEQARAFLMLPGAEARAPEPGTPRS